MGNIIMTASNILISEVKSNRRYMTLSMRMFSTRENLNHVAVTEAFIDDIIANKDDYICMPLCADVPKMKKKDYRGLTHLLDRKTGTFLTDVIGGFYDFEKVHDEFGISLIGHARVNKRIDAVCAAIEELYANNALNFSFEISAGELREEDGVTIVDASADNELTAMAVVSVPAYPESKALDLVAEAKPTPEDFYANTKFIAELDIDTVRLKFYDCLYECVGEKSFDLRPMLFCLDCVILYDCVSGKSYKAEFIVDGDELMIKDFYEIEYVRAEEGSEIEMNEETKVVLEQAEAETEEVIKTAEADPEGEGADDPADPADPSDPTPADPTPADPDPVEPDPVEPDPSGDDSGSDAEEEVVVVDPEDPEKFANQVSEVVDETDDEKDPDDENEIEALRKECAELKAALEELKGFKAELDQIKAEREQAELDSKKEQMREYAIAEGLDVEDENVARAIEQLDHASLMSEVMNNKNAKKEAETKVSFVASFDLNPKGTSYLLGHSKD